MGTKHLVLVAGGTMVAGSMATSAAAVEFFDGRVNIDFAMAQGAQTLEANGGAFDPRNEDTEPGFNRLRFNASLTIHINDYVTGFIDIGEEPNDFGESDTFSLSNDLSFIDISLLDAFGSTYATSHTLVFRAGNPVQGMFNFRGFSDGAAVQSNPLIGNSVFDMVTAESGLQLLGAHQVEGLPVEGFNWDLTFTVPTFFEDFSTERGYHITAKGAVDVGYGFAFGGGYSTFNGGDQIGRKPFGEVLTTEMVFGDNENFAFPGAGGVSGRITHSGLVPGVELDAWHVDAEYAPDFIPLVVRAWYGELEDDVSFVDGAGNQTVRSQAVDFALRESEVRGFGVEMSYYLIEDLFYVAGRYSNASNKSPGVSDGGNDMYRYQGGIGVWVGENTLLKAEYVNQHDEANSPGQIGSNWEGGALELSVVF